MVGIALAAVSVQSQAAAPTALSAVIATYSLTTGDLDVDGKLDLVMASAYDSTVSVLLGNGDGTFLPQTTYATGGYPVSVATAHLDGDATPDLAVANLRSNTVSVLLGNGDGTFGARTDFAAGSGPRSVAIADLNGDALPDLAVANAHSRTVSVLAGVGDGKFGERREFAAGDDPSSVAIADLNRDGHPDLAVANWNFENPDWSPAIRDYISTVSVLSGNGYGTFGPKTDITTGGFPLFVGIGDLNRDGTPDLITAGDSAMPLSVLLGRRDGAFGAMTRFPTCGYGGSSLAMADLNADGKPDVAVPHLHSRTLSVLLGYGDGTFAPSVCIATPGRPHQVVVGDFDADGRPDFAIAQSDPDTITVLLNGDLGLPAAPLPRTSYSVGLWPNPSPGATDIHWVVPRLRFAVDVSIFDLTGRRVRMLLTDPGMPPGAHSVHWNGLDERGARVGAGVYLVRIRVGADLRVARLVVMR
jgi:hypothetical protein